MMRMLLVVAGLLLALTGCGEEPSMPGSNTGTDAAGSSGSPMGKTYLSTAVTEDGKPKQLVPNTRVRLEFENAPNRNYDTIGGPRRHDVLRANVGCNMLGVATAAGKLLADGRVWVDQMGGTEIGCPPPLRDQEEWLRNFLISKPTWHVQGDQLTLTSGGTTITLVDRKIAEPDFPLDGIRWSLESVVTKGDLHAYYHNAEQAWITFEGRNLTGSTGCNELSGTVERSTGKLVFTNIITTDRACGGETAEVEKAVLDTLKGTVTYEIDHNRLALRTPATNGIDFTGTR